ncbi:helix-turn-helix domain-containing protein [Actinosynnema sp. NPDC020468]|uniref:helix-turn-helix domain-containing protein n=1 Tax=Actinosynnema sp. NPDC020468 TaxID=3154488 RepID=UPI0033FFBD22
MGTRQELGRFLRAHRALLDPADVGLTGSRRRRTPGLRREEVAALSGVGLSWYTWLEQGRVGTSREVLDAVARALRLDDDAHRHVLTLAGHHAPPAEPDPEPLRHLVAGLGRPAALVDGWFDVRAGGLFGESDNLVLAFTSPRWRARVPDWEPLAQAVFREFRRHADQAPDAPRARALLAALRADRPDLTPWWECRAVVEFRTTAATVDGVGHDFSLLRPAGSTLGVLIATPR